MERVLITGDRNWEDEELPKRVLWECEDDTVFCHGGARGADSVVGTLAQQQGFVVTVYPAKWNEEGRKAGVIRNQMMLDDFKPTRVIAFHNNIEESKGTKDMIRRAASKGVPVRLYTEEDLNV